MDFQAVTSIFSGVPVEWLVLGLSLILFTGGTMLRGTGYTTALSLALPIATMLFSGLENTALLGVISKQFSTSIEQTAIFLILTIILFVCIYRICATFDHSASPFSALICASATIIVIIVVWVQVPPLQSFWQLGLKVQDIFGQSYRLFWLIAAYLALAFARS